MNVRENELHERIKTLRLKNGYTQQQLADILGIDKSTYAHYEAGRRTPNIEKLKKLAEFYGMQDELLGATLPIVTKVEYPVDMLETFERELNAANRMIQSSTTTELIALYRNLNEKFAPIWEVKSEALSLPDISVIPFEQYVGQAVQKVYLDKRGEYLINKYLHIQEKIFDAIQNGNDIGI